MVTAVLVCLFCLGTLAHLQFGGENDLLKQGTRLQDIIGFFSRGKHHFLTDGCVHIFHTSLCVFPLEALIFGSLGSTLQSIRERR